MAPPTEGPQTEGWPRSAKAAAGIPLRRSNETDRVAPGPAVEETILDGVAVEVGAGAEPGLERRRAGGAAHVLASVPAFPAFLL